MRTGLLVSCAVVLLLVLAGCARLPSTPVTDLTPARTLLSSITVLGVIRPQYYYFLAIDTNGNPADGPIPIVTGSELGNGWGTLSGLGPNDPVVEPPFYLMYHDGTFSMFRNGVFIGQPFRGDISADGKTMTVEIDQASLVAAGAALPTSIELNWITDEMIVTPPQLIGVIKQYDGLGSVGNTFLANIQLNVTQSIDPGIGTAPEELQRDTTNIDDIDMVGYHVEVRLRTGD